MSSSASDRGGPISRVTAADAPPPPAAKPPPSANQAGGGEPPRKGNWFTSIRTFQSLQYPAFRDFFFAMLGQMASQNMQMVVRAYLAFLLTGSYAALGLIALANAVPGLVLSLVGGALADLIPRRKVAVMVGQMVNAANTLVVGLLLLTNLLTFEYLFIASIIQGITMALMMPSRQAMIPALVPGPQLMNAVALNAAGMNVMRLFAPAIGGFLFTWGGGASVYFLMTGLYLLATLIMIRVPEPPKQVVRAGGVWAEMKAGTANMWEGVLYIKRDPIIGPLLLINVFVVITAMPYMFLLAGFVQDVLNAEADALGILQSVSGIGSLAGALWIASMASKRRGAWYLIGSGFQGLTLFIAFVFTNSVLTMAIVMLFMGVGQAARQSLSNVLVQEYVEDAFRGRVMSVYMLQFALSSFAAFLTGMLAAAIGPRAALGAMSMALVVLAFGTLLFSKRLRDLQ